MKMEVIAVQQQYQTQFSGIGSNKYRDWTSNLTPLSAIVNMNSVESATPQQQQQQQIATKAAKTPAIAIKGSTNTTTTAATTNSSSNNNNSTPYQLHHHSSQYGHQHQHQHHHHLHHHHQRHHQSQQSTTNKMKNSINQKKTSRQATATSSTSSTSTSASASTTITTTTNSNNFYYCDNQDIDVAAVKELSVRLLDELRAAKSRHLTCTEVSLPCDLTPSIAAEIIRVSEKEPCGIRGCTIYIEFEDEPNNSRRIASLKLDPETVSTFEVYLTLRQDHRGWASLLPQFMKSLARTITISPEFTITKHKLYSPTATQQRLSYTAAATNSMPTMTMTTASEAMMMATAASTTTTTTAAISTRST